MARKNDSVVNLSQLRMRKRDPLIAEIVDALPALCTRSEVAKALRRNTRTVDRWITLGRLRATRPAGGFPLILRSEVERLIVEGLDAQEKG